MDFDATENRCDFGEEFSSSYEELSGVFAGESYVQDYIDYTEDGELISSYVPLVNSSGQVVGILGSDYDASSVSQQYASFQMSVGVIGGIIFVVGFGLIFLVIQAVVKGIRKVNEKLYELVHNEGDLTQTLEVRSGDEMEIMAGLVNELLAYIKDIMIQISRGSDSIKESSDVMASRLASAGEGIVDVSATMQEMSASMEETSALSEQVTEAIRNMQDRIGNIAGRALDGDSLAKEIQKRAGETYAAAESEQKEAKDSAKEIEAAVAEKIELSKTVNEIMEEFAGGSEELEETSGEIAQSMSDINIAVEESAKGIVAVSQTAAELIAMCVISNRKQDSIRKLRKILRRKLQNLSWNRKVTEMVKYPCDADVWPFFVC